MHRNKDSRCTYHVDSYPNLNVQKNNIPEISHDAFFNMWGLQRSCDIQVATDSCGGKINPVADSVLQKTEKLLQLQHGGAPSGQLEFDAMVRMIDKKDDSYKN